MISTSGPALRVLHEFHNSGVRYCIWRGTTRLERSFAGDSDLDVLIGAEQLSDAECVLGRHGFRRARANSRLATPGIDDFFAFDAIRNSLVHVHLHCRLVAGEKRSNRFRLPWSHDVLATRVERPGTPGLFVADPAAEIVLLLVRKALLLRGRDRVFQGRFEAAELHGLNADRRRLLASTDREAVLRFARRWLGAEGGDAIGGALHESTFADLVRLRRTAVRVLEKHASSRGLRALLERWGRDVVLGVRKLNQRWPKLPLLLLRGGAGGGVLVAILGDDAPAVATLAREIRAVFAPKFDVAHVVFGDPTGGVLVERAASESNSPGLAGGDAQMGGRRHAIREKFRDRRDVRRLRRALVARNRGMIVLCEGFPDLGGVQSSASRADPSRADDAMPDVAVSLRPPASELARGAASDPDASLHSTDTSREYGFPPGDVRSSRLLPVFRVRCCSDAISTFWSKV